MVSFPLVALHVVLVSNQAQVADAPKHLLKHGLHYYKSCKPTPPTPLIAMRSKRIATFSRHNQALFLSKQDETFSLLSFPTSNDPSDWMAQDTTAFDESAFLEDFLTTTVGTDKKTTTGYHHKNKAGNEICSSFDDCLGVLMEDLAALQQQRSLVMAEPLTTGATTTAFDTLPSKSKETKQAQCNSYAECVDEIIRNVFAAKNSSKQAEEDDCNDSSDASSFVMTTTSTSEPVATFTAKTLTVTDDMPIEVSDAILDERDQDLADQREHEHKEAAFDNGFDNGTNTNLTSEGLTEPKLIASLPQMDTTGFMLELNVVLSPGVPKSDGPSNLPVDNSLDTDKSPVDLSLTGSDPLDLPVSANDAMVLWRADTATTPNTFQEPAMKEQVLHPYTSKPVPECNSFGECLGLFIDNQVAAHGPSDSPTKPAAFCSSFLECLDMFALSVAVANDINIEVPPTSTPTPAALGFETTKPAQLLAIDAPPQGATVENVLRPKTTAQASPRHHDGKDASSTSTESDEMILELFVSAFTLVIFGSLCAVSKAERPVHRYAGAWVFCFTATGLLLLVSPGRWLFTMPYELKKICFYPQVAAALLCAVGGSVSADVYWWLFETTEVYRLSTGAYILAAAAYAGTTVSLYGDKMGFTEHLAMISMVACCLFALARKYKANA
jgi:hypothetical protein